MKWNIQNIQPLVKSNEKKEPVEELYHVTAEALLTKEEFDALKAETNLWNVELEVKKK